MDLGLSWGKRTKQSGESSQTRDRREPRDNQKGQKLLHCLADDSCLNNACCQITCSKTALFGCSVAQRIRFGEYVFESCVKGRANGDGQRESVMRTAVEVWFRGCGLALVLVSNASLGLTFDVRLLLCSFIGSLFRMKFWGAKNLNRFRVFMRITFEGEATGGARRQMIALVKASMTVR
jgi:hypothetical protein